jgi:putative oxidoreductase
LTNNFYTLCYAIFMYKIFLMLYKFSNQLTEWMNNYSSFVALVARLYVAYQFFQSGWLKITSWPSTLNLFQNEYKIIGMSPEIAAYLGTAAELVLPVFFLLGLGARSPALIFFIYNICCVIFYPILLTPDFYCALKDHILWGVLIGIILFYGYGKISLDHLLQKKMCKAYKY